MTPEQANRTQDAWGDFVDALDEVQRPGADATFWIPIAVSLYWRWRDLAIGGAVR